MKTLRIISVMAVISLFLITFTSAQVQTGPKGQKTVAGQKGPNWVDKNADGICDNYDPSKGGKGLGNGPRDGSGAKLHGKKGAGKGNGMQSGNGQYGSGVCDGTGPKGKRGGR